jgi:hypothetical protein
MSKYSHIPVPALYDKNLSDGELRLLGKLLELMWENAPSSPETSPLHWSDACRKFGLSKATYFRSVRVLRITGWIESSPSGSFGSPVYRPGPRFETSLTDETGYSVVSNLRPTTTGIKENSINKEVKDSSSSSKSRSLKNETRIKTAKELFLKELGIGNPLRRDLVEDPDVVVDWISAHVRYAELRGDSKRLLAHRLKVRDPLPGEAELIEADPEGPEARARYLKGWD